MHYLAPHFLSTYRNGQVKTKGNVRNFQHVRDEYSSCLKISASSSIIEGILKAGSGDVYLVSPPPSVR